MKIFHAVLFSLILQLPLTAVTAERRLMYPGLCSDQSENKKIDAAVESYLLSLPPEQRISQIFLVNIPGNIRYRPIENSEKIDKYTGSSEAPLVPGGAILFGYNISGSAEDTMDFLSSVASYCDEKKICRPYIAVDQEGGYVARLRNVTSRLPSSEQTAKKLSPEQAYEMYSYQARQMHALGFDMNIAPVSEIEDEGNKDFLDTRSYGNSPSAISYSIAAVSAYQSNGIAAVLKHFPGNTNTDPHTGLPEMNFSETELVKKIMEPFFFILASKPDAVLMSHARTSIVDPSSPASLSRSWVTEKLKEDLSYGGLILSDDIFMGALSKNGFPSNIAAVKAIEAGVHVIMLSEKNFSSVALDLLEHAQDNPEFSEKLFEAEKKVIAFKIRCGILTLGKNTDGSYTVKAASDFEQRGSREERIDKFRKNYAAGQEYYDKYCR
ncbi:MAG: glycoside hydrolase family 3 protein [Treponema sp.]|nr:glycoside hydrolase family 3 protein [Treponema sp.]